MAMKTPNSPNLIPSKISHHTVIDSFIDSCINTFQGLIITSCFLRWYKADYSKAGQLVWGRGDGCSYTAGSCGGYIQSQLSQSVIDIQLFIRSVNNYKCTCIY